VAGALLYVNALAVLRLGVHPRLNLNAVRKRTRRCSKVQRPGPWDLIVTDLLTLGVDLVDRPFVEDLVLRLGEQPERAL
jgi:hypothetical protein